MWECMAFVLKVGKWWKNILFWAKKTHFFFKFFNGHLEGSFDTPRSVRSKGKRHFPLNVQKSEESWFSPKSMPFLKISYGHLERDMTNSRNFLRKTRKLSRSSCKIERKNTCFAETTLLKNFLWTRWIQFRQIRRIRFNEGLKFTAHCPKNDNKKSPRNF